MKDVDVTKIICQVKEKVNLSENVNVILSIPYPEGINPDGSKDPEIETNKLTKTEVREIVRDEISKQLNQFELIEDSKSEIIEEAKEISKPEVAPLVEEIPEVETFNKNIQKEVTPVEIGEEKVEKQATPRVNFVIEGYTGNAKKVTKRHNVLKTIGLILAYTLLVFLALIALLPFYWMIITSLKSEHELNRIEPTFFPIEGLAFENYVVVFQKFHFLKYLGNTLVVILVSTFGTIILTILAAFAFAKLKFRGRDGLFLLLLSAMMIPGELLVTTNYISMYKYGLVTGGRIQSYLAVMLPFLVNIFYIYLLRQNFKQIPNELYLASKVDGKSDWQYLWKVMVPIAMPTIVTLIVLKVISTWNAYAWPSIVTKKEEYAIMTVGLKDYGRFYFGDDPERESEVLRMAAVTLVTIPLIVLFIFCRKYIMRGIGKAGIKG